MTDAISHVMDDVASHGGIRGVESVEVGYKVTLTYKGYLKFDKDSELIPRHVQAGNGTVEVILSENAEVEETVDPEDCTVNPEAFKSVIKDKISNQYLISSMGVDNGVFELKFNYEASMPLTGLNMYVPRSITAGQGVAYIEFLTVEKSGYLYAYNTGGGDE